MEGAREPHEAHAVLLVQGRRLPVHVADGVLKEASDVLETSPFLAHVLGFLRGLHELGPVTIGVLSVSQVE